MTVIRVVIADDHPIVREGLTALLSSVPGFDVVADARTGREALQQVVLHHPDVALLDLQMPELDGFAATREIVRSAPDVAVLVLTMHADDESVFTAMRAGARGYLVKGAEQEEILGAIRAVAAGEVIFGPAVAQRVLAFFSGTPPAPSECLSRAHRPGDEDSRPARRRSVQCRDRPAALPRGEDRRQPRLVDLREAAGGRPCPSDHQSAGRRARTAMSSCPTSTPCRGRAEPRGGLITSVNPPVGCPRTAQRRPRRAGATARGRRRASLRPCRRTVRALVRATRPRRLAGTSVRRSS